MDVGELDPDPVWTNRYKTEREMIRDAAGENLLGVFHVGSTAIPDLAGKRVLDIVAVYPDYESMRTAATRIAEGDYDITHDGDDCIILVREREGANVFIKMHPPGDERVHDQLLFRNYLRENEALRKEYERVKQEAAAEHPEDLSAYTEAKQEIVTRVLERARAEGYDEDLPAFV